MRKKIIAVVLLVTTLMVSGAALARRNTVSSRSHAVRAHSVVVQRTSTPVPSHVTYGFLFNRILAIKQKAAGQPNRALTGAVVRTSIDDEANLSDTEIRAFDAVAFTCVQQLQQQDEKARQVIIAARVRNKERGASGLPLLPPPSELQAMQERRNAIILNAKNRLIAALGAQSFNRLDAVVNRQVSSSVQVP